MQLMQQFTEQYEELINFLFFWSFFSDGSFFDFKFFNEINIMHFIFIWKSVPLISMDIFIYFKTSKTKAERK